MNVYGFYTEHEREKYLYNNNVIIIIIIIDVYGFPLGIKKYIKHDSIILCYDGSNALSI